jgi:hypothetical protein
MSEGLGLEGCAVCGGHAAQGARMSRVVIEGRALELCRAHTATVVAAMPETFEDLRTLFVGAGGLGEGAASGRSSLADRRSPIDRREPDDRRVFPPRPEGRRLGDGRRAGDARD